MTGGVLPHDFYRAKLYVSLELVVAAHHEPSCNSVYIGGKVNRMQYMSETVRQSYPTRDNPVQDGLTERQTLLARQAIAGGEWREPNEPNRSRNMISCREIGFGADLLVEDVDKRLKCLQLGRGRHDGSQFAVQCGMRIPCFTHSNYHLLLALRKSMYVHISRLPITSSTQQDQRPPWRPTQHIRRQRRQRWRPQTFPT